MNAALDHDGNAYTAQGIVYVISSFSDVDFGDDIGVQGAFADTCFLVNGTTIQKRNLYGLARRRFNTLLLRLFPVGETGNLSALLLTGSSLDGSTTLIDYARQFGLSYILALSGMHLTLVTLALRPFFRFLGGHRWGDLLTFACLLFFVYSTGWKPSLTRALLFLFLSRNLPIDYSFPLSLLFLLLFFPSSVSD
ncbi:MAG: ComEC/Rec2 family competence protein, partial [Spirochaetales bacterium]|nr:ComEC/Rec2 family competence protein [Candidatus Physcosoma equi]